MLTCPLCKLDLPTPAPKCPRCQTDLALLANFVTDLQTLLAKADSHRRAGELAPAVQAYFDVLDVDPANAEARAALGPVLRAVRASERLGRPRRWPLAVMLVICLAGIITVSLAIGFYLGFRMAADLAPR